MKLKLVDATVAILILLAIGMTILSFLTVRGPAVDVRDFKVPDTALTIHHYSYWVPILPQLSIYTILSSFAARKPSQ
jgi:hypothetical protein